MRWRRPSTGRPTDDGSASVYATGDVILVRTSDLVGFSIERDDSTKLTGDDAASPHRIGESVLSALEESLDLTRASIDTSAPRPEYHRVLMEQAGGPRRSWREWQRRTRFVTVSLRDEVIELTRYHPDLGRGAWQPLPTGEPTAFPQHLQLAPKPAAEAVGLAVLDLLREPSIWDELHP